MANSNAQERLTRIAIVDENKCKPDKCGQECKKGCPVIKMGKLCITIEKRATISETLCNGCGICVKKCPFNAISIINLPKELSKDTTHRYHENSFKLHRLPIPRIGHVLGLVGQNGIGKSTALKILAGKLKPNLGQFQQPPDWNTILTNFRGSTLQNYFKDMIGNKIESVMKPQLVYSIPKVLSGTVVQLLKEKVNSEKLDLIVNALDLEQILDRDISKLSGGELQRFAIAMACASKGNMFIFDEPSSFLDIKQRLNAAKLIRSIVDDPANYVVVVEHDLSILDFLSDYVSVLYGTPGIYGVITLPSGTLEGINNFMNGFIPAANLRFRPEALSFKTSYDKEEEVDTKRFCNYSYPNMTKTLGDFKLSIKEGNFTESEIIVLLGQNGTGKSTFIKLLAGKLSPDEGDTMPELHVSYKPQEVEFRSGDKTVRQLLESRIPAALGHSMFISDVLKPMNLDVIMDQPLKDLSGGETQRVAIVLTLGIPADVYLLDEPSAMIDAEQRLVAAKVIKRFIMHAKKTAFIVEHDFVMATYLADRVVVYDGTPSKQCCASSPLSMIDGMNKFLSLLDVTVRRDKKNFRPRINKMNCVADREQKKNGTFFFMDL